ncbi:uncharacterized protein [Dermacentor andersoni]|uniref:uncharacterized protein isoform X1 n=1 Tax=Dermacentor andersoni TaxID=34620 RepID=UPI002416496F|nr:uncharacterized protein LOC126518488 isoform X1 [Dermacentor andersoni]
MAYAIVDFISRKEVEVVPSSWISDDICMWPKVPLDRLTSMIRKKHPCSYLPPWQGYEVQVKGLFGSYDEARRKLDKSQYTSDLGSDSEPPQKRRTPAVVWDPCQSSDSQHSEDLPPAPVNFPQAAFPASPCSPASVVSPLPVASPMPAASPLPVTSCVPAAPPLPAIPPVPAVTPVPLAPPLPAASPAPVTLPPHEFQSQVLRLLNILRLTVQEILSNLDACVAQGKVTSAPAVLVQQPFETVDALLNFEASLRPEDANVLVNELVQLGGRTPNAAVKRMLIYLFADKLAAEYSWHGKKGKRKFADLRLCQHLFTAVRRRFPQSTRDDVESTTKSWLRHAPERANGREGVRDT